MYVYAHNKEKKKQRKKTLWRKLNWKNKQTNKSCTVGKYTTYFCEHLKYSHYL